jgi:hypothetical protein
MSAEFRSEMSRRLRSAHLVDVASISSAETLRAAEEDTRRLESFACAHIDRLLADTVAYFDRINEKSRIRHGRLCFRITKCWKHEVLNSVRHKQNSKY